MPVTPSEIISLSKELVDRDSEVYWRSAASRAYYAIFHLCEVASSQLPEPLSSSVDRDYGLHEKMIRKFTLYTDSDIERQRQVRSIGRWIGDSKDIRTKADYHTDIPFSQNDARQVIHLHRRINQWLQTLSDQSK